MKNVMVVIDESNSSYDLLIWVLENLKDITERSKVFIFAKQPQNSFTSPSVGFAQFCYPLSPNVQLIRLAQEKNTKIALGILEKAKKICGNHGIKAETFTDVGDTEDSIRKIIQERKIDLFVISDQQNRNLERSLQKTDCSLLVVKKIFSKN
uniref:UspA domain-containing protein n=1 Tax=Noccaea caerulescens TaxID=107243 RepID=A0A1J3EJ11_NOCCA